jgi:putative nucleotidyltransferase with HDIG domain
MRAVEIEALTEGMKVARTIYDDAGRILLSIGAVLNSLYIKKLAMYGIPFIYIEDEVIGPLMVEDVIHDRVRLETVKALKNVVANAKMNTDLDFKPVSQMVNKILDDLKGVTNMLVQLMDMRTSNMYIYNHSVGVCVLSIMTGMALSLDELKIKTLGMGAILHDIGKSLSPGPEHTIHGFEILRNNKILNIMASHVAYQHHERYDGSGYPRQLKGEDIHLFAAITGIANFYDNLVSNPDPSKRLYPYQALEMVIAESGRAFHPQVVGAFSRNIAPYPVGTAVRLNNGAIGVVIKVKRDFPTRPLLKLIKKL